MKIRSNIAAAQTRRAAPPANPQPPAPAEVQYLDERSFYIPLVMSPYREISREEAAKMLGRGEEVAARVADDPRALPLRTPEDQQELEVFTGNASHPLAEPAVSNTLQTLAGEGWRYFDDKGEIGLYGAYNTVTENDGPWADSMRMERGQARITLKSADQLRRLQRFYSKPSALTRLEAEKTQFFAGDGRRASLFELEQTQPGQAVGAGQNDEVWLQVQPGTDPSAALSSFAAMRAAAPTLEKTRLAWDFAQAGPQRRDQLEELLRIDDLKTLAAHPRLGKAAGLAAQMGQNFKGRSGEQVMKAYLNHLEADTPDELAALALEVVKKTGRSYDTREQAARAGRAALTQLAKSSPVYAEAATLEQELRPAQNSGQVALLEYLLEHPRVNTSAEVLALGRQLVDDLGDQDAAKMGAALLQRLQNEPSYQTRAEFALQLSQQTLDAGGSKALFVAVLQEPDQPVNAELGLAAGRRLSGYEQREQRALLQTEILKSLATKNPYTEALALHEELAALVSSSSGRATLSTQALEKPELDTTDKKLQWGRELVEKLGSREGRAVGARLLEKFATGERARFALEIGKTIEDEEACRDLYQTTLGQLSGPVDAAFGLTCMKELASRYEGKPAAAEVGLQVLRGLAEQPEYAMTASLVEELGRWVRPGSRTTLLEQALTTPVKSNNLDEFAAELIGRLPDQDGAAVGTDLFKKLQQGHPLREFAAGLSPSLESPVAQKQLLLAALKEQQPLELALSAIDAIRSRSNWEYNNDVHTIAVAALEKLQAQPPYDEALKLYRELLPQARSDDARAHLAETLLRADGCTTSTQLCQLGSELLKRLRDKATPMAGQLVTRLSQDPALNTACRQLQILEPALEHARPKTELFKAFLAAPQSPQRSWVEAAITEIDRGSSWEYAGDIAILSEAVLVGPQQQLYQRLKAVTQDPHDLSNAGKLLLQNPPVTGPAERAAFAAELTPKLGNGLPAVGNLWLDELGQHPPFSERMQFAAALQKQIGERRPLQRLLATTFSDPSGPVDAKFAVKLVKEVHHNQWDYRDEAAVVAESALQLLGQEPTFQQALAFYQENRQALDDDARLNWGQHLLEHPDVSSPEKLAELGSQVYQNHRADSAGEHLLQELGQHQPYKAATELALKLWSEKGRNPSGLFEAVQLSVDEHRLATAQRMLSVFPANYEHKRHAAIEAALDWLGDDPTAVALKKDLAAAPPDLDRYRLVTQRLESALKQQREAEELMNMLNGDKEDHTEVEMGPDYVDVGDVRVGRN